MDKTAKINFRVSERLRKQVEARAAELGMKISDYIRYLITKDIEESRR
jgi:antitoxin component of RelBE/YafQ-DinJ toxin-antitoxin module